MGISLLAEISVPDWLPWTLMAVGGAVVIVVVVWFTLTKRNDVPIRQPASKSAPQSRPAAPPSQAPARGGYSAELSEVKSAADLLLKQLDDRAQRLERLIAEADLRVADLERAAAQASGGGPGSSAPKPSPGASRLTPPQPPAYVEPEVDLTTQQILTLAAQGLTPLQIAQRTGQGIGMVELVLALRR